jgi:hypothetical protein
MRLRPRQWIVVGDPDLAADGRGVQPPRRPDCVHEPSQWALPRPVRHPACKHAAATTSATTGSAHHHPRQALAIKPIRTAADRYALAIDNHRYREIQVRSTVARPRTVMEEVRDWVAGLPHRQP